MGSRAVLLVCRSPRRGRRAVRRRRRQTGAIWTRTGRPFFPPALTEALLDRLRAAAEAAGLLDELATSWLLLDAEMMPWSAKAGPLLRDQYAPSARPPWPALPAAAVGAGAGAADRGLPASATLLDRTGRGWQRGGVHRRLPALLLGRPTGWTACASPRSSCSPPRARVYFDRPHLWHLGLADRLAAAGPGLITPTRGSRVDYRPDRRRRPPSGGRS